MTTPETAALMENQQTLREIRDEIRMSRSASGATSAQLGASRPPGAAFFQSQLMADKVALGQWDGLGWAKPYSNVYQSTLSGDMAMAMGLHIPPSNMTFAQSQEIGQGGLARRAGNFFGGMVLPGYTGRIDSMSSQVMAESGRFLRFGNSQSAFGAGATRAEARGIASAIHADALSDLRMDPTQAGTIFSQAAQYGQFDYARNGQDAVQTNRELIGAITSLTRAMHTSSEEANKMLGQLRGAGVDSIASQSQVLMGVQAASLVSGVSNQDLFQRGLGFAGATGAMNTGAAMDLYNRNVMMTRELGRTGVMSSAMIQAGGGALGIAQDIGAAQMNFMRSDAGFMTLLGQRAGMDGGMDQMLGGLKGMTSGGMFGMLETQMSRSEIAEGMSAKERESAMRSYVETQVGMFGVDPMSRRGQSVAYQIARNQMGMGESAAHAYVRSNFSEQGRLMARQSEMQAIRAEMMIEDQDMADQYATGSSLRGKMRLMSRATGAMATDFADGLTGLFYNNQEGALGFGGGAISRGASRLTSGAYGSSGMSIADRMAAMSGATGRAGASGVKFAGDPSSLWGSLSTIGGMGGAALGAKFGAKVGLVGGIPGMVVGGAIGAGVGYGAQLLAGASGVADNQLSSSNVKTIMEIQHAASAQMSGGSVFQENKQALSSSGAYRGLLLRRSYGLDGASEVDGFVAEVNKVVSETGVSTGDVITALRESGADVRLPSMQLIDSQGAVTPTYNESALAESMETFVEKTKTGLGGLFGSKGLSTFGGELTDPSNMRAMHSYLSALKSDSGEALQNATKGLRDLGFTREQIHRSAEAFKGYSASEQTSFLGQLQAGISHANKGAMNRDFRVAARYAKNVIGGRGEFAGVVDQMISSGDESRLITELLSSDSKLGAHLASQDELFSEVRGLASAEALHGMNAAELSRRFNMSSADANSVAEQLDKGGLDAAKELRRALATEKLTGDRVEEATGYDDNTTREAELLSSAAQILDRLMQDIKK